MSISLRSVRLAAGAAFAGGVLALAPPALAGQAEQFNRADGVAGVAPFDGLASQVDVPVVSSDGRTAYFPFKGYQRPWNTATGLWKRDLLTNRSTPIFTGIDAAAIITGLSADDGSLSFTTFQKLSSADTNGGRDLYRYVAATGAIQLVSRADGPNGAVLGVVGDAFVTRDGKSALFETSIGVARRDLATGHTVKLSSAHLGAAYERTYRADTDASADGNTFIVGNQLVTPTGTIQLAPAGTSITAQVDEAGAWAFVRAVDSSTGDADPRVGTAIEVATGNRTTITLPTASDAFLPHGIEPSGGGIRFERDGTGRSVTLGSLSFKTGAVRSLGLTGDYLANVDRSGRFATGSVSGPNTVTVVVAADGVSLPGGVDLPAANAYVTFTKGCARGPIFPFQASKVGATFPTSTFVPAARSVRLQAYTTAGALLTDKTFTTAGDVAVPSGLNPFKLVATISLVDGRTITETQAMTYIGTKETCTAYL
jgi:hypothetical protein